MKADKGTFGGIGFSLFELRANPFDGYGFTFFKVSWDWVNNIVNNHSYDLLFFNAVSVYVRHGREYRIRAGVLFFTVLKINIKKK